MTSGNSNRIIPANLGLVMASIITAPTRFKLARSAMENPEPEIDWINVVSVVSRDKTSPVLRDLKESWVLSHYMLVHRAADIRNDSLAKPGDQVKPQCGEQAERHRNNKQAEKVLVYARGILRQQARIDQVANCNW